MNTSAAPSSRPRSAVGGEDVGGGHRQLEEDVEVEEVAGEEHPGQPGGEQDDQPGERALAHAVGDLVDRRGEQRQRRQQGEQHAERVGAQA